MTPAMTDLYTPLIAQVAAQFPPTFVWGGGTSSYQIEGALTEDGRGRSIWDEFAAIPGKIAQGHSGAVAIDHYHRYAEDVGLMAEIGLRSYRFSVSWPRILPEGTGAINQAGIDFYDRLVDALLAHGIAPALTLYHWDLPSQLDLTGGWLARATAYAFADYAEIVFRRLGDRVRFWQTMNEPQCHAFMGYGVGGHAPGHANLAEALTASHYLLLGHGLAMQRLRSLATGEHQLGIALNLNQVYGQDDSLATQRAVFQSDTLSNTWFLDPLFRGRYPAEIVRQLGGRLPIEPGDMDLIRAPLDYLGVNYYTREVVRGVERDGQVRVESVRPIPGACYTMSGWEVYPQGLTDLLLRLHRDYAPAAMYITENGAAFADEVEPDGKIHDVRRLDYLYRHLTACAEAMRQGVPLQGYFVWSIFDNFEWADGYRTRFGLIYVDYATQRRILKDSGLWYSGLLAAHRRQQWSFGTVPLPATE